MSSESFLGHFVETQSTLTSQSNSSMDFLNNSDLNYEFLGNIGMNPFDINSLDPFGCFLSNNPDQCSLDYCYKLLYQKLIHNDSLQKLYGRVKEIWKEVISALRNLEWKKAQTYLSEIDSGLGIYSDQVFRHCPAIVMWSPGGRIHYANQSFYHLTGYVTEELKASVTVTNGYDGKINANQLFHGSEIAKILQKQLEAIQTSKSCVCSFLMRTKLLTKSKREIPVSCSINNLQDTFGVPILTTMVILC